jgi:hypothetical protein
MMGYKDAMELEWYWQLIARYCLLFPLMMATRIIGLSLGVFSPWAKWEYFVWPLVLSAAMTWWARKGKQ